MFTPKMIDNPRLILLLLLALFLSARPAHAITAGQLDTFQDGTTNDWTNGGLAPPITNIDGGGPGGAGDRYIQMTADGSGAGGRLTTFNNLQWSGDYISAAINTIEIDLLNQSAVDLSIRLAFRIDTFRTRPAIFLPPCSCQWAAAGGIFPSRSRPPT